LAKTTRTGGSHYFKRTVECSKTLQKPGGKLTVMGNVHLTVTGGGKSKKGARVTLPGRVREKRDEIDSQEKTEPRGGEMD